MRSLVFDSASLAVLEQIRESLAGLVAQVNENTDDIKTLFKDKANAGLRSIAVGGTVDIDGVPSVMAGDMLMTL